MLAEGRAAPGHVFNLGHGVLPETDPEVLTRLVDLVHELGATADLAVTSRDPGGRPGARPGSVDGVRKRVAVIGGGIAGLAAAVRLRDLAPAGTEIIVYEQSGALGGKLRTGELARRAGRARRRVVPGRPAPTAASRRPCALARRLGLGDALRAPGRGAGRARRSAAADADARGHADRRTGGAERARPGGARPAPDADRDAGRPLLGRRRGRRGRRAGPRAATATRSSTGWSTRCSAGCTRAAPTGSRSPSPCRAGRVPPASSTPCRRGPGRAGRRRRAPGRPVFGAPSPAG